MLHEDLIGLGLSFKKIQKLANDETVRYRYYDSTKSLVYKSCTKCDAVLPVRDFRVRTASTDGLEMTCRTCVLVYERSYHKDNPHVVKNKNKTRVARLSSRSQDQILLDRNRLRPTGEKRCIECKTYKPLDEYSNSICNPDGLSGKCKMCDKTIQAVSRTTDPNYASTITRRMRTKNLQRTDKQILKDRERTRPSGRKKCKSCKTITLLELFHSDRGNTDGLSASCAACACAYTAWRKRGEVELQWISLGIPVECYVCGGPWDHTDHVVPKELGGTNDITNLLPMCEHHNTSKWMTPLDQWLYRKHPHEMERVLRKVIFDYGVDPFP